MGIWGKRLDKEYYSFTKRYKILQALIDIIKGWIMEKRIVLSSVGGGNPVIVTLAHTNGACSLYSSLTGTACISGGGGVEFAQILNGVAKFKQNFNCGVNLGIFDGELKYFGYGGGDAGRAYMQTAYKDWLKVNKAYDDEAIATENYYAVQDEISPACPLKTFEKGDLLYLKEKNCGQFSTSYPQSVEVAKGVKNEGKSSVGVETKGGEYAGSEREKEEERACANGEVETGEGDATALYYRKIEEEIEKLFNNYDRVRALERAVDSSKFVKITYAEGKYYVVGKTVLGGVPEYLIFGVPSCPDLPEEITNTAYPVPTEDGAFYLFYQSARTGELLSRQ